MSERDCESVGIDLGTTYSSLAYMDKQRTPRVVCDSSGQSVMPSVVFFDDDEVIVGDVALSQAHVRADRAVQFIKVHMGDLWRKEINGQVHTPESVSALILGQLIREAELEIGPISSAVITVPAYFTEKRRRATQQAGEIAGINVVGTLNEPMAATLAYGLYRARGHQNAVVYDLGGGTFDVTIVRIGENELEELATNGNRQLGGRDWDRALIDYISDDFQKKYGNDPRESPQSLQDLQIECEHAKRRLGRMAKTSMRFHAFGHDHTAEVTREKFEELTSHLRQATKLTTEIAIEDAGLDWRQISRIVMVGGSTHMPSIRQMLQDASGIKPDTGVNPVAAVALGAAIYAHMLDTGHSIKTVHAQDEIELEDIPDVVAVDASDKDIADLPAAIPWTSGGDGQASQAETLPRVRFVTAHGVGVKVFKQNRWCNAVVMHKNTSVPAKMTRRFNTLGKSVGARNISIEITQGDTEDANIAESLGVGRIELPAHEPPGSPVEVTMEFDEQGRLHTSAVYVKTGHAMNMWVEVQGGLKEEQVQEYRKFMEKAGFSRAFDAAEALAKLDEVDDEEDDVLDLQGLDSNDDDIPMIEPL